MELFQQEVDEPINGPVTEPDALTNRQSVPERDPPDQCAPYSLYKAFRGDFLFGVLVRLEHCHPGITFSSAAGGS